MLIEILKDVKENKDLIDKLLSELECLQELLKTPSKIESTVDDVNEVEIPLNDELYHRLCKELGSNRIFFMGIA